MDKLPDKILCVIINELKIQDKLTCRLISHRWVNLIDCLKIKSLALVDKDYVLK